ncbi:hypothetical protein [Cellulomonas massiliensis]|uniref:hypothetical protein n=1 Tax=Cellulomonas massiliensis TaxID=1465811 RepID=UPI00030BA2BA|nr:hypothetical protein [Cellulomonas massiliensis]
MGAVDTVVQGRSLASGGLVGVVTVAAVGAVVAGAAQLVLAATGRGTSGTLPVRISGGPARADLGIVPAVEGWAYPDGSFAEPAVPRDVWPGGQPLPVQHVGGLGLTWWEPSGWAVVAAGAPLWLSLLVGGLVALLLVPVLRSWAHADPFAAGAAPRLAGAAAALLAGWALVVVLPHLAARHALATHAYGGPAVPDGWLTAGWSVPWWPLTVVALLAVLAWATHRGRRLARDTEGLV